MQEVFEKIIEKLEEKHEQYINQYGVVGGNPMAFAVKECKEIVKQEEEEYNNGWIPCSSGNMPDDLGDVLIDMGGRQSIPAYFHNGEWYLTDCRGSSEKVKDQSRVKAWQPLPQSYQPKGE